MYIYAYEATTLADATAEDQATANMHKTLAIRVATTKPVSHGRLRTKIFGGVVVLLCLSIVFSALSRSRGGPSGFDLAEDAEAGRLLGFSSFVVDPEESDVALGQRN